ncbi:PepSY domain-containing protein [Maricaulis sp.]|uniref:PepSY domain-containing protein n=1 Tax=Maricaulis sp. TaxID=1486257 RepID=UPI0025C5866E|nr:PepSY domain-containing protein [Maricaulis sp.]
MKLHRLMSQIHLWLGAAFGVQVMLWLVSGLVMVIIPIEEIRGEHLRHDEADHPLDWADEALPLASILAARETEVTAARTGWLAGQPVWRLETAAGPVMINARTGVTLSPISEALAVNIAATRQNGLGEIADIDWLTDPPREAGLAVPAWRIDFAAGDTTPPATFYINSQTGELRAVRTTAWRVYDFFWGVHIMDWSSRENFNSWWIKVTTMIALLFGMAGAYLTVWRLWMMGHNRRA